MFAPSCVHLAGSLAGCSLGWLLYLCPPIFTTRTLTGSHVRVVVVAVVTFVPVSVCPFHYFYRILN